MIVLVVCLGALPRVCGEGGGGVVEWVGVGGGCSVVVWVGAWVLVWLLLGLG